MSIYSQPYTYLIGWSTHRKFYYGVRYALGCHPGDLWTKYFTSSSEVTRVRTELGEPDIISVRRTFSTSDEARDWEHKVLRRMDVVLREDFLNKTYAKAATMLGKKQPESMKQRLRELFTGQPGRKWSKEEKLKQSERQRGKIFSEEHRASISAGRTGMKFTEEHRLSIGKAQIGRVQSDAQKQKRAKSLRAFAKTENGKKTLADRSVRVWSKRTPEERAEIGRRISEAKQRAKAARLLQNNL